MTSKIHVLSDDTINKIAAGEVIENPSSVVKELIDNSLDAGSTEITVEISSGGRQLIRVSDNGSGMGRDDALLCLERHATSKIREIDDVAQVMSMGFRGEAIPSIASISKFTLLTRSREEQAEATMLIVDGGRLIKCCAAERSTGTTIEVKSLFFNVPVRKKFQRSPKFDTAEIQQVIIKHALAHPNISFHLISNQKTLLKLTAESGKNFEELLGERIVQTLGRDFFAALKPITLEKAGVRIRGFLGIPAYTRHNRTGQYLLLNRRAVLSPMVSFAIKEGYGTRIASDRHPVFVVHLEVPSEAIDVNVHPQKKEVRFRRDGSIRQLLIEATQKALGQAPAPYRPSFVREAAPRFSTEKTTPWQPLNEEEKRYSSSPPSVARPNVQPSFFREESAPLEARSPLNPSPSRQQVLGAITGYIIVKETDQQLVVVDQQAAHRRILFERLLKQFENQSASGVEQQALLMPITLEYSPVEATRLREKLPQLQKVGIEIEDYGQNSFGVNALPSLMSGSQLKPFIDRLLADEEGSREHHSRRIALAASYHAVSKKECLSLFEAQALFDQLMSCSSPYEDPFGRPTVIKWEPERLANQFNLKNH